MAAEKLAERHGLRLGVETVRRWMLADGIWRDRRQRLKPVHQPRYRRECLGELILTLPERGSRHLAAAHGLVAMAPPLEVEGFGYQMVWHDRDASYMSAASRH